MEAVSCALVHPSPPGSSAHAVAQQVLRQFQSWRQKTPLGIRRIPEDRWVTATQLAASATVHQVSRLLGLDYVQLKRRVIAAYGADCPALPGRFKRQSGTVVSTSTPPLSGNPSSCLPQQKRSITSPGNPVSPSVAMVSTAPGKPPSRKRINSGRSAPSGPGGGTVRLPIDGFLEASLGTPHAWLAPPLLAEIRFPTGALLRLFSPDTAGIVKAFLQP